MRMQRVHVKILESFRSAVILEFAILQAAEEGGFSERLASTTGSLHVSASRPSPEALNRSRSAVGLSPCGRGRWSRC